MFKEIKFCQTNVINMQIKPNYNKFTESYFVLANVKWNKYLVKRWIGENILRKKC